MIAAVCEPPVDELRLWRGEAAHGPSLDDLVAGAWEGLAADAPVTCLLCGGAMLPRYAAGAGVVGGRCESCGSSLG